MIVSSQGLNIEAQDWREDIIKLAAMNPRSKVELLTKHLKGKHGGGGDFRDQSSLQQGVEVGTSVDPDLGITMAVEQWRKRGKGVLSWGFPIARNK